MRRRTDPARWVRPGLLLASAAGLGSVLCLHAWYGRPHPFDDPAAPPLRVATPAGPTLGALEADPHEPAALRLPSPAPALARPPRAQELGAAGLVSVRPGTEGAHYLAFVDAGRADPAHLERLAPSVLEGAGPRYEKVALLRALYDTGSPATASSFVQAVRGLSESSDASGSSVPGFAVRFLGERAARDAKARAILEHVAFEEPRVGSGPRRRAAARLAELADEDGLRRMSAHLARETDALLLDGVAQALSKNPSRLAAERVALGIGREIDRNPAEAADG